MGRKHWQSGQLHISLGLCQQTELERKDNKLEGAGFFDICSGGPSYGIMACLTWADSGVKRNSNSADVLSSSLEEISPPEA